MLDLPKKVRKAVRPEHVKIAISLGNGDYIYTTHDRIRGHVSVMALQDTDFDDIAITLNGVTTIAIERPYETPAGLSHQLEASHSFLRLRQSDLEHHYPDNNTFRAGSEYTFPFNFVVPDRLTDSACRHAALTDGVRDAHLSLPPSFSDDGQKKVKRQDTGSSNLAKTEYIIAARITKTETTHASTKDVKIASQEREVTIIPTSRIAKSSKWFSRAEHRLKKTLLGTSYGTLVMEAERPDTIALNPSGRIANKLTTAVVMLRFEPTPGSSQKPRLGKILAGLKATTEFSTKARSGLPSEQGSQLGHFDRVHRETFASASRTVSNVKWCGGDASEEETRSKISIVNPCDLPPSRTGTSWTPSPSSTYEPGRPYHLARIVVPIELPEQGAVAPTFHSCLISRFYSLKVSLSLGSANRSISVSLPTHVATTPPECGLRLSGRSSIASGDTAVASETATDQFLHATASPDEDALPKYTSLP